MQKSPVFNKNPILYGNILRSYHGALDGKKILLSGGKIALQEDRADHYPYLK